MKEVFIINNNYEIIGGWVDNVDKPVCTMRPRYIDSITSKHFDTEAAAKDYLLAFLRAKVLEAESKCSKCIENKK